MTSLVASATVRSVVVGAGQSGLATGFYLRRAGLEPGTDFVILNATKGCGCPFPPRGARWNRVRR